jgi:hypothetical protein
MRAKRKEGYKFEIKERMLECYYAQHKQMWTRKVDKNEKKNILA